jgi:hypothetical protein
LVSFIALFISLAERKKLTGLKCIFYKKVPFDNQPHRKKASYGAIFMNLTKTWE